MYIFFIWLYGFVPLSTFLRKNITQYILVCFIILYRFYEPGKKEANLIRRILGSGWISRILIFKHLKLCHFEKTGHNKKKVRSVWIKNRVRAERLTENSVSDTNKKVRSQIKDKSGYFERKKYVTNIKVGLLWIKADVTFS